MATCQNPYTAGSAHSNHSSQPRNQINGHQPHPVQIEPGIQRFVHGFALFDLPASPNGLHPGKCNWGVQEMARCETRSSGAPSIESPLAQWDACATSIPIQIRERGCNRKAQESENLTDALAEEDGEVGWQDLLGVWADLRQIEDRQEEVLLVGEKQ